MSEIFPVVNLTATREESEVKPAQIASYHANQKMPSDITSLEFPGHKSVSSIARQITREESKRTRSIRNRLHSIAADAAFVADTAKQLALPLIANERCGRWYVPSPTGSASCSTTYRGNNTSRDLYGAPTAGIRDGRDAAVWPLGVYFKSTDGHYGEWGFSLRRLNLGVLECLGHYGGCIIVDSTRRGKHMPDALSKTVPIWCAIMNRLLFPESHYYHSFFFEPRIVPESEASQIDAKLDSFLAQVKTLELDLNTLRGMVSKPMKPVWICRSLGLSVGNTDLENQIAREDFLPVYLCMASLYQAEALMQYDQFEYVQGAGDDAESWSGGLTPRIFWQYKDTLLTTEESELPDLITSLCQETSMDKKARCDMPVFPGSLVFVGILIEPVRALDPGNLMVVCAPEMPLVVGDEVQSRVLHLKCGNGKLGSRDLRRELGKLPAFLDSKPFERVLVRCSSGTDLSVGVALAILVLRTNEQGTLLPKHTQIQPQIHKALIRKKLCWIMTSIPTAHPSRTTLNSVNSFLMKEPI